MRRLLVGGGVLAILSLGGSASAQTLSDDPAFVLYRQAVEAMQKREYGRARELAGQAIAAYPGHILAHYLAGQAALAESQWEPAAAAFTRVTELYPGSFAGHRDLGVAYQQLRRVEDAARAYEAALALRPTEEALQVRLALMLLDAGLHDRARRHLQDLANRETRELDVWTALASVAYDAGDLAGAERALVTASGLQDDGRTWFNLGAVRVRRGDYPGALDAFERAARHPDVRAESEPEIAKLKAVIKAGSVPPRPAP